MIVSEYALEKFRKMVGFRQFTEFEQFVSRTCHSVKPCDVRIPKIWTLLEEDFNSRGDLVP